MCHKIWIWFHNIFSATGLAWQVALKKIKVKLALLTDINMLLMVEKVISGGICHSIYRYTKANNRYMKDYAKNKESSCLQYWDVNNLYSWAMSQQLPVNNFEWIRDTSQINEDFIKKTIMKKLMNDTFLNLAINILKTHMNFIMFQYFYFKE